MAAHRYRVLIADDHPLVADGINRILDAEGCEVVGMVTDGRTLLAEAERLKPDLVCLDISMPEMTGIEAAIRLRKALPTVKIIFVTQQLALPYLRAAFRAGAVAYVAKQAASSELLQALGRVRAGKTFITSLLATSAALMENELIFDPSKVYTDQLTDRQREVLQLLTEGRTNKEIAANLRISPKTVEFHKEALMNELGIRTTAELTRYALTRQMRDLGA